MLKPTWLIALTTAFLMGAIASSTEAKDASPYLCNLARIITSKSTRDAALHAGPNATSTKTGMLIRDVPIYICDERGEWYKVFYAGACKYKHLQGIESNETQSCKSGWVSRKKIEVISG